MENWATTALNTHQKKKYLSCDQLLIVYVDFLRAAVLELVQSVSHCVLEAQRLWGELGMWCSDSGKAPKTRNFFSKIANSETSARPVECIFEVKRGCTF